MKDQPPPHDPADAGEGTETLRSGASRRPANDWALIVAMDCQALASEPTSVSLAGISTVSVGRGPERWLVSNGPHLRLDLADRFISKNHARLTRTRDGWAIQDDGSKNGIRVNGLRVERKTLNDGDVLECGGTFQVLRRARGSTAEAAPVAQRPEPLRTLSPAFDHELTVLRKVAASAIPVLVLGDSGTGKEGMAKVIHELSGRGGPFVVVNCGGIPPALFESELFGCGGGASSSAEDRLGLLRGADRGTLFLDEIADLPLPSQGALLRVLQQREIVLLGTTRPVPVDLRVIAATNRPIAALLEEHRLRRDLFARLNGHQLRLPLLRERREDLGLLIAALIARHEPAVGRRTVSIAAARCFFAYSWPWNIRELEQSIGVAMAVTPTEIGVEHLPLALRIAHEHPLPPDRERVITMMEKHGGNLSAVARELRTSRSQIYRTLSRHGIRRPHTTHPVLPPLPR